MAATAQYAVTTSWTKRIVTATTAWTFQNIGPEPFYARYDAGTPTSLEQGHLIRPGEGMTAAIHGVGDVWFTTIQHNSNGMLAVTS